MFHIRQHLKNSQPRIFTKESFRLGVLLPFSAKRFDFPVHAAKKRPTPARTGERGAAPMPRRLWSWPPRSFAQATYMVEKAAQYAPHFLAWKKWGLRGIVVMGCRTAQVNFLQHKYVSATFSMMINYAPLTSWQSWWGVQFPKVTRSLPKSENSNINATSRITIIEQLGKLAQIFQTSGNLTDLWAIIWNFSKFWSNHLKISANSCRFERKFRHSLKPPEMSHTSFPKNTR